MCSLPTKRCRQISVRNKAPYAGIDACLQLSFRELKLDKIFLDRIALNDRKCAIITKGIVSIMNELGVRVVCEGAETAEQCREILELGCNIVQGYFFSKPVPSNQFYEMYASIKGKFPVKYIIGLS